MKKFKKVAAVAMAVALTATMTVPALAAETDGFTQGGGNFSSSTTTFFSADNQAEPEIRHNISYYVRTKDKGTLDFVSATVVGRHTVGGENVPSVSLPGGWFLQGYYINGNRYSASDLAGYLINENTQNLQVEIRTYPDSDRNGSDDRNEKYYIEFEIRSGHKGELEFERSSVIGTGKTLSLSEIPKLTDKSSKTYSISGYYVDGKKYTRSELSRLEIEEDMDIEVRTYRNSDGSTSSSSSSNNSNNSYDYPTNGYDWRLDPGTIPNGYYLYNPYYYGLAGYGTVNGTYPLLQPQYLAPYGYYTAQFIPQNGAAATYQNFTFGPTKPANPKATGYTFVGWSTDKYGKTGYWNFNAPVAGNITLYGIWVKNAPAAR